MKGPPAGGGADRACLTHIGFAVVPLAEGKELQQFTGQVFVGVAAVIGRAVEPELDLGGLFGLGPPGEPAEPLALQGLRLPAPAGPAGAGGETAAEGAHDSPAPELAAVWGVWTQATDLHTTPPPFSEQGGQ